MREQSIAEKYEPVIGLEVHAELNTRTKMFCGCLNDPLEEHPNVNVCPVCMGHPGALPVINRDAVLRVMRVGLALGGEITPRCHFDRKNYFYPDLPKGYQISQYKYPIVSGGMLNGVRITRVHLEEDAGRLAHTEHASGKESATLVDYNRASVPLMELVTEPDVRSSADAKRFAEELQMLLRYVGVSDADMERGQMRIEANISIRPKGTEAFGTKVEVKNINSFRAVEKAIEYEIVRQAEALEAGEKLHQETRGWDDVKNITVSQRSKEEANDYRYFPEPDLPPLELTPEEGFDVERMRAMLPELPWQKRARFGALYKLPTNQVEFFVANPRFADYYEKAASELREWVDGSADDEARAVSLLANYLTSDFQSLLQQKLCPIEETLVTPENFAELIKMIHKNEISSRVAKDVLMVMFADGSDPTDVVREQGLGQVSDAGALEAIAQKIIEAHSGPTADYKGGKINALQFLVGQVMKETKGTANPEMVRDVLTKILQ
jgi:aspartyl-tRNA(Asn)/glutamyl-tRNA(Gln) amidotransferase subunit B